MSHELRTPLNAVLGFSQLMARRHGRDAEDLEQLAIIGRSGEHLLGLINDVLSLSKIEAGALAPIAATVFEPAPIVLGLTQMLSVRAKAKGLDLLVELDPSLHRVVVGDDGKLRQILLNLLSNAVKFTGAGHVVVRARWSDGIATFEVEDTGAGLTPLEIDSLFEPFTQAEAGLRSSEGTGLGLTISRSYARLMGGDIELQSKKDVGSTFTLRVPLPDGAGTAESRARGERRLVVGIAGDRKAPHILVVDDVSENRLLLKRLLHAVGFTVDEADGGDQAYVSWRDLGPDLILMDMRMRGMGGMEATRRIREAERRRGTTDPVRIVALSASVLEHEQTDVLAGGCDDFLGKPFREGALFEKLAQQLDIEYLYERPIASVPSTSLEGGSALTSNRLMRLSPRILNALREAILVGDDEAARASAESVRAEDAALAEALLTALRAFQIDRLLTLLEGTPQ